jgi:hypothetical protein
MDRQNLGRIEEVGVLFAVGEFNFPATSSEKQGKA